MKARLALLLPATALALALTISPLLATTATTKFPLTNSGWTDLGAGPLLLSFSGQGVYAVADTTPAIQAGEGFSIDPGASVNLKTVSHVWARASGSSNVNAYTAPIVPAVSPNCAQAATYLTRTAGGNEGGNALAIKNLICGLVSDGVITGNLTGATGGCGTYLDALWLPAQQNAADAALNLCGTSYTLVPGANVFTSYKGWVVTVRIDTGLNSATAPGSKWILNSASQGAWINATLAQDACMVCTAGGTGSALWANTLGHVFSGSVNTNVQTSPASPAAAGYYAVERRAANDTRMLFNGAEIASSATPSVSVYSATFGFPATTAYPANNAVHVGAQLGPTLQLALYNRLRIYMTSIGVP